MQAVILVGGLGTRLRSVTDLPKPMAPVAGKPFLDYLVNLLCECGIFDEFVFLAGYKSELVEAYAASLSVKTKVVIEPFPMGTAGALFNAWDELDDVFFVFNGDTFFDADLNIINSYAKENALEAIIALRYTENADRYSSVKIDKNGKVTSYIEKTPDVDCYINAGIYRLSKKSIENWYLRWQNDSVSLEMQIFQDLVEIGQLYALPLGGMFIDIGVPEDYYRAGEIIPSRMNERRRPALFLDRDNTLIEDKGYTYTNKPVLLKKADEYIRNANQHGWYVIIVSNQAGVAKGYFSEAGAEMTSLATIAAYGASGLLIDDFYHCPYHVEGTVPQYTRFSYCRKPNPGMLLKACEKYKIDLANSIMLGDKPDVDMICLPYLTSIIV